MLDLFLHTNNAKVPIQNFIILIMLLIFAALFLGISSFIDIAIPTIPASTPPTLTPTTTKRTPTTSNPKPVFFTIDEPRLVWSSLTLCAAALLTTIVIQVHANSYLLGESNAESNDMEKLE